VWGRLSLRAQAAIAVLAPCLCIALFVSIYFPARLNEQAERSLETQALALGELATAEIAPTLRLIRDGLAPAEDLEKVLQGVKRGGDVAYMVVLPILDNGLDAEHPYIRSGEVPKGKWAIPAHGCELDHGDNLVLRCLARDEDARGLFIAAFKRDQLLEAKTNNRWAGVWSGLAAAGLALVLAFLFSGALAGPVGQVTQAAREVAAGDVTVSTIRVTAAREITSMAGSFNEMLESLRDLVSQMVALTGRLTNASQGLIGASRDQEQVTGLQAAYAQEIAATFEELSRTAEQISASTDVVDSAARRTNEAVEEAKAVVRQVVDGISAIRDESKEVADAIQRLNADLQQVSRIAQLINQIAERSDLLALNAALEGTKAGEVGRGFSLVAAEMRKLAESVAASARDIGRIVEKVGESGSSAVAKALVGVETSDRGMSIAEQASVVFQRISELARGTSEAAQQITVATRQQRQSSEQAVDGARNVADLVKQGVDATGRTTRIAQDLEAVAQALAAVTGRFKVSGAPDRPS
jgi:methyl-accepting chemotaxis protein